MAQNDGQRKGGYVRQHGRRRGRLKHAVSKLKHSILGAPQE